MPERDEGRAEEDLPNAAVTTLQDAVGRGMARRARREHALGREISSVPASTSISIKPAGNGASSSSASLPLGSIKPSLIPGAESDSDEESNDEWEEHVEVDAETAQRAVQVAERVAAKRKADARRVEAAEMKERRRLEEEAAKPTAEEIETAEKDAKKKFAARERARCSALFDAHLTILLGDLQRMDTAANTAELQAIALSTVPPDVLPSTAKVHREALARFALWARCHFRSAPLFPSPSRKLRPASQMLRALRALSVRSAHVYDVGVALAAALRADGARARIVVPLRPHEFMARAAPAKASSKAKGSSSKKDSKRVVASGDAARKAKEHAAIKEMAMQGANLYAWLEVWSAEEQAWLSVDFISGAVDVSKKKLVVENMREHALGLLNRARMYEDDLAKHDKGGGTKASRLAAEEIVKVIDPSWLARIVAIEGGVLTDVTRRYVSRWKLVQKERGKRRPLEKLLEEVSKPSDASDTAVKAENRLFDEIAAKDEMPTSVAALHKHPRYVLERHLKKYETVFPREAVGHLKEEPIYLRSNVHLLHSKDRWTRQMRVVRDGEEPLKHVKSMKSDADEKTALYGEWQTDRLVVPAVVDGKVPRSARGNVELWTAEHLPAGGVHVPLRHAAAAARALSVDYADAMTGFDIRAGRSVPRIEGVVVAAEFAEAVRAAALEKGRLAYARAEAKLREEACGRWKALLRAMEAREKVRKKYGGHDGTTYVQQQKRLGEKRARESKQAEEAERGKRAKR